MTDTTASLRHRIDGAAELRTVVRTMKAQAAVAITQYDRSVIALADYQKVVELGLSASLKEMELVAAAPNASRIKQVKGMGAVVFGSDQGLVGRFNDVIADHAIATLAARSRDFRIWGVGARVQARLAEAGFTLSGSFAVPGTVQAITSLVGQILLQTELLHAREPASELYLFFNRPTAAVTYTPVSQRLLPLDAAWHRRMLETHWPKRSLPEVLGVTATTLKALIGEYLFVSLFRAAAESLASENASRLSAMQRAEKSIDERLIDMNATFHRLRQSSIDEELFDVISGFEALSK
jgi:F-type H+-transporting ATPase subunit gamma